MTEEIKKPGQPTKYKGEYHCKRIQELSAQGYLIINIAEDFDVHTDTIYEWRKVHPEFSVAFTRADQKRSSYYMSLARQNLVNKDFNFNMFRWMTKFVCHKSQTGETVYVPGMSTAKDELEKIRCTIDAMAKELITPDEAEKVITILDKSARCISNVEEFNEMKRQLQEQIDILRNHNNSLGEL